MTDFKKRLSQLEGVRATANLKSMSDENLDAYITTLVPGSQNFYTALVAQINRHGSTFPIIYDDPEYPAKKEVPV